MKKRISQWLVKLAQWIDQNALLETVPEAQAMGLCIHISKKDVKDFRKTHPEIKSHREGMKFLAEETKWRIAGAIGRGMMEKDVINFDVKKTLYIADVSGVAFVYGGKKETNCSEKA